MNKTTLLLATLLLTATVNPSTATRDLTNKSNKPDSPVSRSDPGVFFGPGTGFDIPGYGGGSSEGGWSNFGGGYGAGYGGPGGGYTRGGIARPSVVCNEKGPCYKKKLTCPAKCFSWYSRSGSNYGGGGGGGGCTMDCKKRCVAYC